MMTNMSKTILTTFQTILADTRYMCNLMQNMIYTYASDASLTGGL